MIHVSCKRMFFKCRCPADFGSILFLVVVSVRLSQLRRNSNCWICNYLSWERERRHIEWGGEVNTQGLTPPRLLKRSTKPFFYLRWNNSSARTAITAEAHHSFQMTFSIIVRVKTTLPSSRQIYYCKHKNRLVKKPSGRPSSALLTKCVSNLAKKRPPHVQCS